MKLSMLAEKKVTEVNKFNILRLFRCENVGPKTFYLLLDYFGSADNALEMIPEISKQGGLRRGIKVPPVEVIEKEIEMVAKFNAKHVFANDAFYPTGFRPKNDFPPVFTAKGNISELNKYQFVGIVGSRDSSHNGNLIAREAGKSFADMGIAVVSGMAKGIDAEAHSGCLPFYNVAVLAGGLDNVYPPENKDLYDKICEFGLVISEQPIGSMPLAKHFPQRNKLIAGLADCVLVVEAAAKSGSLITANITKTMGKKVFAVPGSPMDRRASGTNQLIKSGDAELFSKPDNIIDYLNSKKEVVMSDSHKNSAYYLSTKMIPTEKDLSKYRDSIVGKLSYTPTPVENIIVSSQIPAAIANFLLLELELAGKIERSFGNKISLISSTVEWGD
jgi:DNA processing protein